jgi:hypothetical protein
MVPEEIGTPEVWKQLRSPEKVIGLRKLDGHGMVEREGSHDRRRGVDRGCGERGGGGQFTHGSIKALAVIPC